MPCWTLYGLVASQCQICRDFLGPFVKEQLEGLLAKIQIGANGREQETGHTRT